MNYFSDEEFQCSCGQCEFVPMPEELRYVLNHVREHFGSSCTITSGYRCPIHNENVGGVVDSAHTQAIAADIVFPRIASWEIHEYLDTVFSDRISLGSYNDFTHVDLRPGRRW